jgi:isocitrate dehydrogenase
MMAQPGYDMMTDGQQAALQAEVSGVVSAIGSTHGNGQWKGKLIVKDSIADITLQQVSMLVVTTVAVADVVDNRC